MDGEQSAVFGVEHEEQAKEDGCGGFAEVGAKLGVGGVAGHDSRQPAGENGQGAVVVLQQDAGKFDGDFSFPQPPLVDGVLVESRPSRSGSGMNACRETSA